MGEFFIGVLLATIVTLTILFTTGGPLASAQSDYTRCISDGGTQPHCVEKYLLPKKETP